MFIDVNIFMAAAVSHDLKGEKCRRFLSKIESGSSAQ